MKELVVTEKNKDQKLIKFLSKEFQNASNGFLYKMLRKKNIVLNGKKADGTENLCVGDVVKVFFSDETYEKMKGNASNGQNPLYKALKGVSCDISIVYEDEDIIAVNKPVGILSQKAENSDISINEMAISYLINSGQLTEDEFSRFKPSVLNRLDRNTSGIVIVSKTYSGALKYSEYIKNKDCEKYYHAILVGKLDNYCIEEAYLLKDENNNQVEIFGNEKEGSKYIKTSFVPIKNKDNYTLAEIRLYTGRPHQIRAHGAYLGFPVLGDSKYGNKEANLEAKKRFGIKYQMLHAYKMVLPNGVVIEAKDPEIFEKVF